MYGAKDLKERIKVTEDTVECPVRGCVLSVARQRKVFKKKEEFKCPKHRIYISPSTFEYEDALDNILWKTSDDCDLLFNKIAGAKLEMNRFARDNSEDAVTWNVFRYMEKEDLLTGFLSEIAGFQVSKPEAIYWSYSQREQGTWTSLRDMREKFETKPKKGSEPDLIVQTENALFFIEPKLTATNNTIPSSTDPLVREKYESGCGSWYRSVFRSDFETVAIRERKYELLRFWLLGSKLANVHKQFFFLVSLTTSRKEQNIEQLFGKHIRQNSRRIFIRSTWEDVYYFVLRGRQSETANRITDYLRNKTTGYDGKRRLQIALVIEQKAHVMR